MISTINKLFVLDFTLMQNWSDFVSLHADLMSKVLLDLPLIVPLYNLTHLYARQMTAICKYLILGERKEFICQHYLL